MITAVRGAQASTHGLEPEHLSLLRLCRLPASVADLAADLDLPLGVVRVLLSDMRERGLIAANHPVPKRLTDPQLLREVADGLRRL
jgi:DNA-binding IclR family transcriptional regulator